ncbi:U-scoloptoxin(16)-Er13a-like [Bacillus rossius redtenbacheri]|uniref:U-scoloptoxin(16)-Er13a-like n=1 Tax=Bacillus rossius redtenbacheri TaxID=93214 RepID=UPI002FDE392D
MSLLSVVVVVTFSALMILQQYECQLAQMLMSEDPNHPGKCVYENQPHDVDSEWTEPGCQRGSCHKNQDGTYRITLAGCGKMAVPGGCTLVSNNSLPYPECCPKLQCD